MDDIVKIGVRTKVLLLSATPVNNDLKDLRNQIYFMTEGSDTGLADTIGVASIKDTLTVAQKVAPPHESRLVRSTRPGK